MCQRKFSYYVSFFYYACNFTQWWKKIMGDGFCPSSFKYPFKYPVSTDRINSFGQLSILKGEDISSALDYFFSCPMPIQFSFMYVSTIESTYSLDLVRDWPPFTTIFFLCLQYWAKNLSRNLFLLHAQSDLPSLWVLPFSSSWRGTLFHIFIDILLDLHHMFGANFGWHSRLWMHRMTACYNVCSLRLGACW